MQAKRIVAKDMRTALSAVRDVLGPQAIILSNKRVSEGIELLCTLDQSVLQDEEKGQITDVVESGVKTNIAEDFASPSVNGSVNKQGNGMANRPLGASVGMPGAAKSGNKDVGSASDIKRGWRRESPDFSSTVQSQAEQGKTSQNADNNKPAAKNKTAEKSEASYLARELDLMQKQSRQRAEQIKRQLESKRKIENKHSVLVEEFDYPKFEDVALPSGKKALAAALSDRKTESSNPEPSNTESSSYETELLSTRRELNADNLAANASESEPEVVQELSPDVPSMQKIYPQASSGQQFSRHGASLDAQLQDRDHLPGLRAELNSMRELLQERLDGVAWRTFNDRNPLQARLWRRLRKLGLEPAVIQMLLAGISCAEQGDERETLAKAWMQMLQQLAAALPINKLDIVNNGGVHAFVGPTGVGKTTSIGKLATDHVMQHGNENIALVTTDTYRIGGLEQLKMFGRLLNVPVKVVDSPERLAATLHGLRSKHLVMIDSAGLSIDEPQLNQQLQTFRQLDQQLSSHLVLSAAMQPRVNQRAYQCYRVAGVKSCIISKLDESSELGSLLSLLIEQKLPASYVTNGQKIPDDMHTAEAGALVNESIKLTRLMHGDNLDEWQLAEEFSMPLGNTSTRAQTLRSL